MCPLGDTEELRHDGITCDSGSTVEHRCRYKDQGENVSEVTNSPQIVLSFSFICHFVMGISVFSKGKGRLVASSPLTCSPVQHNKDCFLILFSSPKGEVSFVMHVYLRVYAHAYCYC